MSYKMVISSKSERGRKLGQSGDVTGECMDNNNSCQPRLCRRVFWTGSSTQDNLSSTSGMTVWVWVSSSSNAVESPSSLLKVSEGWSGYRLFTGRSGGEEATIGAGGSSESGGVATGTFLDLERPSFLLLGVVSKGTGTSIIGTGRSFGAAGEEVSTELGEEPWGGRGGSWSEAAGRGGPGNGEETALLGCRLAWGEALSRGSLKTDFSSKLSDEAFLWMGRPADKAAESGKAGVKVRSLPGVRGIPALRTGDWAG